MIGYGSPIRGDDAIGPLAAERLSAQALPPWVKVAARHVLTAELVSDLIEQDMVIFLDAAATGTPGEVVCRPLTADASQMSSMAHFLDPSELLCWCERLHGHAPRAYLITASGRSFEYAHFSLSPEAEAAMTPMVEWVLRLIETAPTAAEALDGSSHRPSGQS